MLPLRFAFASLLLTLCSATSHLARDLKVHASRSAAPAAFTEVGPASPEQTLTLRFALDQNDPNGLIDALYSVSDPESPTYQQWLSKDQVAQFVAPKADAVDAVNAWLKENDLTAISSSAAGDWISFEVPVGKANELFGTEFNVFAHKESGKEVVRTLSYSLPASLQQHVDLVHPTITFPDLKLESSPTKSKRFIHDVRVPEKRWNTDIDANSTVCTQGTIPACLQELYHIPSKPVKNNVTLGVTVFYGNEPHYPYLTTFLERYRTDIDASKTNYTFVGWDGGKDVPNPYSVIEGDLDIQYTVGVATGAYVISYTEGNNVTDGVSGFLDEALFLAALNDTELPQVLSTSYAHFENNWDFDITNKICQVYAQLSARGSSLIFATGDDGAGCDFINNTTDFIPNFPATCPYITAVGGTSGYYPQVGWTGSSGGFSNYFARPPYQEAAVSTYLHKISHHDPNAGRYNASGRAIPDVAVKADNYTVYDAGYWAQVYGTSAACPVFASIVTLLNDRLVSAGRHRLGFLNPWLYAKGAGAFADIAAGYSSVSCSDGDPTRILNATAGWDPVTGLGTPDFDRLLKAVGL
ncbi:family S53 protease-like protein [Lentinus tigrinus ALCF2SS1-7]|uniref:tripeptidyl-peptidase II n=1 Tax=Lentinus tigrinus ALCF2SS1-6 TaxID=1328759 RepID=A0A5C2SQ23_9APHY|nr:family S53 protease-like protein [Lentinus tigrinus ALCF2SS1-6]RPD79394.1 family S53 protease-like protein [Lentinus tigrinus ALCF2SS1-7]